MGLMLTALDFCAELKICREKTDEGLKGIVHIKINILSSFTCIIPTQHDGLFFFPCGAQKDMFMLFSLMKVNEASKIPIQIFVFKVF